MVDKRLELTRMTIDNRGRLTQRGLWCARFTGHWLRIIHYMVNDSSDRLDTVFLALSDPTRRAILQRLAQGEASGTQLAQPFSISVPAISKHLHVLERAALIVRRKEGRVHRFRLSVTSIKEAATWLDQYQHFWETQLDELATYLEATSEEDKFVDDTSGI